MQNALLTKCNVVQHTIDWHMLRASAGQLPCRKHAIGILLFDLNVLAV